MDAAVDIARAKELTGNGHTALLIAAFADHLEVVRALLRKGANVNFKDQHGQTALFFAALKGNAQMIELLLLNGAKTDVKTAQGGTPPYGSKTEWKSAGYKTIGKK